MTIHEFYSALHKHCENRKKNERCYKNCPTMHYFCDSPPMGYFQFIADPALQFVSDLLAEQPVTDKPSDPRENIEISDFIKRIFDYCETFTIEHDNAADCSAAGCPMIEFCRHKREAYKSEVIKIALDLIYPKLECADL